MLQRPYIDTGLTEQIEAVQQGKVIKAAHGAVQGLLL